VLLVSLACVSSAAGTRAAVQEALAEHEASASEIRHFLRTHVRSYLMEHGEDMVNENPRVTLNQLLDHAISRNHVTLEWFKHSRFQQERPKAFSIQRARLSKGQLHDSVHMLKGPKPRSTIRVRKYMTPSVPGMLDRMRLARAQAGEGGAPECPRYNGRVCNGEKSGKCSGDKCECIGGWHGIACQTDPAVKRYDPMTGTAEPTQECRSQLMDYMKQC